MSRYHGQRTQEELKRWLCWQNTWRAKVRAQFNSPKTFIKARHDNTAFPPQDEKVKMDYPPRLWRSVSLVCIAVNNKDKTWSQKKWRLTGSTLKDPHTCIWQVHAYMHACPRTSHTGKTLYVKSMSVLSGDSHWPNPSFLNSGKESITHISSNNLIQHFSKTHPKSLVNIVSSCWSHQTL